MFCTSAVMLMKANLTVNRPIDTHYEDGLTLLLITVNSHCAKDSIANFSCCLCS